MAVLLADKQIIVSTNSSLSAEGNLKLLIVLAILSLIVAIGFVGAGAWLVLPFAGLELLAFAYAFYYISLHVNDVQVITVIDDKVIIETRGYQKQERAEFSRYWAQVHLRKQKNGLSALFIGSHGKEVEFGRGFINEEQRVFIAKELKLILKKND
jgi:uncharacterized membrane protein